MTGPTLPTDLSARVAELFGLTAPVPDLATLGHIAAAVHQVLGYDTTPKQRWLAESPEQMPPFLDPATYWEMRLESGASGTCFATSAALDAWLRTIGFDTRIDGWDMIGRVPGTGFDHGTNVVTIGGVDWVLETSASVRVPLRWPTEGTVTGPGDALLTCQDGTVRMHVARAANVGVKTYEHITSHLTPDQMLLAQRDTVRQHPVEHTNFVWARTRADGLTVSVAAGTYRLRDGNRCLADAPISEDATAGVLLEFGYDPAWVRDVASLGAFSARPWPDS